MITTKITQGLKNNSDAIFIREAVFVKEQGFKEEFDSIDEIAYHVVLYVNNQPVACGRGFQDITNPDIFIIGRIATLKQYRGQHFASNIMHQLEQQAKACNLNKIRLSSQLSAKGFYETLGYQTIGPIYLDQHCEHISMIKNI